MATCIQAGVLADGQALALANGDVLLQGHIAVHGAILAVKDDTAVAFVAVRADLNVSAGIIADPAIGPHDGVAADGHCGCAVAGPATAKNIFNSSSLSTGGQFPAVYGKGCRGTIGRLQQDSLCRIACVCGSHINIIDG